MWRVRRTERGMALEPTDYDGRPARYGDSIESVEDVISAAVVAAVRDQLGEGVTVVGQLTVNVNIQLASGGGAYNVVGGNAETRCYHP
jgi:hypothetical protein